MTCAPCLVVSAWSVQVLLGKVFIRLGKHAEAEALLRDVFTEGVKALGPRHPSGAPGEALALCCRLLSTCLGREKEAAELCFRGD